MCLQNPWCAGQHQSDPQHENAFHPSVDVATQLGREQLLSLYIYFIYIFLLNSFLFILFLIYLSIYLFFNRCCSYRGEIACQRLSHLGNQYVQNLILRLLSGRYTSHHLVTPHVLIIARGALGESTLNIHYKQKQELQQPLPNQKKCLGTLRRWAREPSDLART